MRFEARELKPYADPVSASDLKIGAVYFTLQFVDAEMLIPELEAVVFLGKDLLPDVGGMLYFQDASSYRQGIRFQSARNDEAAFYTQAENETKHIFEYEHALDGLLACSLRRKKAQGTT